MVSKARTPRRRAPSDKADTALSHTDHSQRARMRVVLVIFLLVYAVIGIRLVRLQVDPDLKLSNEDLAHIGQVEIHRPRGDILDRNGRVLATDRQVLSLSANPSKVVNDQALAQHLAAALELDQADLVERLNRRGSGGAPMKFVWIKRWLADAEVKRLGDLDALPNGNALLLQEESLRFYPEGELAAHVLGFANRESVGAEGVEMAFDKYLRSEAGRKVSRVDRDRNFLDYLTLEYNPPTGGDDVQLSIDSALQYTLETQLDFAIQDKNASHGMGLLMDPDTGAILALAARPAFDPNNYNDYPAELRKNRALTDVFEPGSAFKIVPAAAALEHGLITPNDLVDCENGEFNPYGRRIRDTHPMGIAPFWESFSYSSNISIIKVAALLGEARMEEWIRRFGFGTRTGIELPGESPGIFRPVEQWSGRSMGALPIGQEMAVNMLQLAQSFSAIANGGVLVKPYVVERAVSKNGETTYRHDPSPGRRILTEDTAEHMKMLCYAVVAGEDTTGRYAVIPEYRAGGKTGTAQIARPDGKGYYSDRYTTVFAGFAPVRDPKLTCVIVVAEPMIALHYGGYVCGPVFKEVMREALVRLNVPPDPMPTKHEVTKVAQASALNTVAAPVTDADTVVGRVEFDALEPVEDLDAPRDALTLLPAAAKPVANEPVLPDLRGLTKWEAKNRLVELGLHWDPTGAGRVVEQDPAPGTPVRDVSVCRLVFAGSGSPADGV